MPFWQSARGLTDLTGRALAGLALDLERTPRALRRASPQGCPPLRLIAAGPAGRSSRTRRSSVCRRQLLSRAEKGKRTTSSYPSILHQPVQRQLVLNAALQVILRLLLQHEPRVPLVKKAHALSRIPHGRVHPAASTPATFDSPPPAPETTTDDLAR